jgi:hypothetical protein
VKDRPVVIGIVHPLRARPQAEPRPSPENTPLAGRSLSFGVQRVSPFGQYGNQRVERRVQCADPRVVACRWSELRKGRVDVVDV